jgi:signal transduction histidine kinase/FixJ family two-component response regulator
MPEQAVHKNASAPSPWLDTLLCAALVAATAYLRLVAFPTEMVPLGFGLPLLICFWIRERRLLYGMAVLLSAIAIVKTGTFSPSSADQLGAWYAPTVGALRLLDIWIMAGVIAAVIHFRTRLEVANVVLAEGNERLEASNAELTSREEEIVRQNEELQSQAEELEQQTEELRQQGEELAQQNEEYQVLNEELSRRERALQALLESARDVRGGLSNKLFDALCRAALQVMDGHADAVSMLEVDGSDLVVRGYHGNSEIGLQNQRWPLDRSFAKLVMDRAQTGYITDLALRPDIEAPQPLTGRELRSLLAAPLRINDRVVGTIEAFSYEPRDWTQQDFQVLEWAAAHCSLILEAAEWQEELERRRREADEAATRKTRFLAAVSHDVRTPANAIGLLAEYLEQTVSSGPDAMAEIPQLVRDLRESARSLVSLVTEVLDLARFDSGKVDLQITHFCLSQAIQTDTRQLMRMAEQRGLRLELACNSGSPICVNTDRVKLSRVLNNLVDNAIKFTQTGSIQVRCGRTPDGGVRLAVSDTGIGIAADQLPHVFDEFHQLRNPARDRNKGTGLGLAISKRLAEAMGGRLEAVSQLGEGTTFTLTLPSSVVDAAPDPAIPAERCTERDGEAVASGQPLKGLRVLLVEDHEASREITSRLLQAHGADVMTAPDGRTGLHRLMHDHPHVLLLDLMLPDMDGREILRSIQRQRPPQLRCTLAVSGDLTSSRAQEVRTLGADGLIPKPLEFGKLIAAISRAGGARPETHAGNTESCRVKRIADISDTTEI